MLQPFAIECECPMCGTPGGHARQWKFSDVTVEVQPCDSCRETGVAFVTMRLSWMLEQDRRTNPAEARERAMNALGELLGEQMLAFDDFDTCGMVLS